MSQSTVMFAVASPHDVDPIEVDKVARITRALDAQLELFHCTFDTDVTPRHESTPAEAQEHIHQLLLTRQRGLESTADRLRSRGVYVRTSVRWDHPIHEGIVRQVLRSRPRLLIARPSHRGGAAHLLLSGMDWKLIETCPCPLLLLKTHRPYTEPLLIAAVDPGHAHDKPAALDEQILTSAALMSNALSGRLEVFHARTPWDEATRMDPELRDLPEYRDEEIHRRYVAQAEARVLELAERHNIAQAQVRIEDGHAAEALPRYANERRADIVAMGAVSRSWLRRVLIGHTAERVLNALDADLLIVKPQGFRTPVHPQSTHHIASHAEMRPRLIW